MNLVFAARGGAAPQGKPKIYFTGHPKDYGLFLKEISADLLAVHDCAVYYDREPASGYDRGELEEALGQMRLLVVPVTARFLQEKNRALEVEFPYAAAHGIPILPIMQEYGLRELFARKCGKLQYLRYQRDDTELPYREKLIRFLDAVLVGDDLSARIRDAFGPRYLFLSYRKKDRSHALELMRSIHRDERFRDVAVWYDEFLVPGEQYSTAIQTALEGCALFAMALTPSMLERGNYVRRQEYPAARRLGKPVFPAEMVPMDRAALAEAYPELGECVDPRSGPAMGAALERLWGVPEPNEEPEHLYLIGMAYLSGVHVETDHVRGLKLIVRAAEAGLEEAVVRLTAMYRNGSGVPREYREAIRWQEKLAALRWEQYQSDPSEGAWRRWYDARMDLGDWYRELPDLPGAQRAFQELYTACEAFCGDRTDVWARELLLLSSERLAEVFSEDWDFEQAQAHYQRALAINEAVYQETGSTRSGQMLASLYTSLGEIQETEARLTEGEASYQRALAILLPLAEKHPTQTCRSELARVYKRLGSLTQAKDCQDQAEDYYQKAVAILRPLSDELRTVLSRDTLAEACYSLGNLYMLQRRLDRAQGLFQEALNIYRREYARTKLEPLLPKIARTYGLLGSVSYLREDISQAEQYFREKLALHEQMGGSAADVLARLDLVETYKMLSILASRQNRKEEGEELARKAVDLARELAQDRDAVEARRSLARVYVILGFAQVKRGAFFRAQKNLTAALDLRKRLYGETGAVEDWRELATCYLTVGSVFMGNLRWVEGPRLLKKGLELRQAICAKEDTVGNLIDLADACALLGRTHAFGPDRAMLQRACEVWDELCRRCPEDTQFARRRDGIREELWQAGGRRGGRP